MKILQLKEALISFISWFGWLSYIFWLFCYVILMIFVGVLILLMPITAYIVFSFTSAMSRLVLGGIAIGDTKPSYHREFELTPSDGMGYSLATAITSIAHLIFSLILLFPLKLFIANHTGMPMETPIAELPSYILESINHLRPPHRFSLYCGIISVPLIITLYFSLTRT
ncbi:hypothetical protein PCC7424_5410 (plasmid) [Gloeothece citriformis PCC 7424]|uniref:Uncharacterized protein n=1 Tax=Gloeothece citriformis (strain PCC 7424) TaxID=65393 RepID=B7KMG6_GLOC7|nr:hypothetical protein [Gloeothece citriformis]ACK73988.1 hypothetical protein PCC7424_5410 [Gloeothece citriformis PCC 7424]